MAWDAHKNLATSRVATAPSPAASGTSLVVTAGDGTKFPATPFNATIYPTGQVPTQTNSEIVRVTTIATDTLTISRATEGPMSARTVIVGDVIEANITAKTLTDVEQSLLGLIPGGRLTLTSVTPVTTADVTGATNLLYTPYLHNKVRLFDGSSSWNVYTFSEITKALGTLVNGQAYDAFAFLNAGSADLELAEWANATVTVTIASPGVVTWTAHGMSSGMSFIFTTSAAGLPTGVSANTIYYVTVVDANTFKLSTSPANREAGTFINTSGVQSGTHTGHQPQARQTALVLQDGVLVKNGATTRLYLGTIVMTSTTATEDSFLKRYVWNYYNRVTRAMRAIDTTDNWTYNLSTFRQANNNAANQLAFVVGVAEVLVRARVLANASNATVPQNVSVAVGPDVVTSMPAGTVGGIGTLQVASSGLGLEAAYDAYPTIGSHFWAWLEKSITGTGATSWLGDAGLVQAVQTGIFGALKG